MKTLTSSTYTFADMIADNRLYVDKTAQIHELIGCAFSPKTRNLGRWGAEKAE